MFNSKTTLASYVSGIFFSEGSKNADSLVASILQNLGLAETMAARAKAAVFKARSNRATYERYLSQPESKRRRASIEKQQALRANHNNAASVGELAIKRVVTASQELIKLIPAMMQDSKHDNPSSDDRLCRSSNCVLVSRFLTGLSAQVAQLRAGWKIEEKDLADLAHGGSDFMSLESKAVEDKTETEHLFDEPLDIFFVEGVEEPALAELEVRLAAVNAAIERANQLMQFYTGAKSRFLNDEQFKARIAGADGFDASRAIVEEYNNAMLDFEQAHWALKICSSGLYDANRAAQESLVAAKEALRWIGYEPAYQGNLIHVKMQMVRAHKLRRSIRELVDSNRGDLRAYHARQAAFDMMPAVYHLPQVKQY